MTDFRTGAVTYAPVLPGGWLALGEDGTVAGAAFRSGSFNAWLDWTSPRAPRLHRLPLKTSGFCAPAAPDGARPRPQTAVLPQRLTAPERR